MKKLMMISLINIGLLTSGISLAETLSQAEILENAINKHDHQLIREMINSGFDVNSFIEGEGTLLIMAVKNGDATLVNSLIKLGANVNLAAINDGNPIIAAAMNNHLGLAKRLLNEGADINAIVEQDETALINASRFGYFDMVKFLVENGADINLGVNVKTINGYVYRSPLKNAKTVEIREYLEEMGANIR